MTTNTSGYPGNSFNSRVKRSFHLRPVVRVVILMWVLYAMVRGKSRK